MPAAAAALPALSLSFVLINLCSFFRGADEAVLPAVFNALLQTPSFGLSPAARPPPPVAHRAGTRTQQYPPEH